MAEIPRNKGQFSQSGSIQLYPLINGSVVNHDGTVEFDVQLTIDEFPTLYGIYGDEWTDTGKGDVVGVTFRTPNEPTAPSGFVYRIRF